MSETTYHDEQTQIAEDAGAGNPPDTVETLTDRLAEIAQAQQHVRHRQRQYEDAKSLVSDARKAYEKAVEGFLSLCARLTAATTPLPLFDGPVESGEGRLQALLGEAGATVTLETIIHTWTAAQRAEAGAWAEEQIEATKKAKPGYTMSVRWPDFMDDAVSEIDT